jgi:hypothetical protein
MYNKFEKWTVTWIDKHGNMTMIEPENKEEVIELLKELQEQGQDMAYVNVFPPRSNLTYEELGITNNAKYIIASDEGYWNNYIGWVEDKESATIFYTVDWNLPMGRNVRWEVI